MAKAPLLDTGTVANLLRWHPNTIRDHLIPAARWKRGSTEIPSIKIGGRYFIPRWWVDEILEAATVAPPMAEDTEDAAE